MTENVTSDDLHDHKNDFFVSHVMCHIENVTSDDLHGHNNDFCVSHAMWHIKWKVMTSVFDLQCLRQIGGHLTPPWPKMWPQMTSMTTTMTFAYHMSCDISNERLWLQYSTFNVLDQLEVIWPHHDQKCDLRWLPWPQQWLFRIPCHVTYHMKGNDFSIRPINVLDQLEVIWPHHDWKCDFRWPPWP